MVSRHCVPQPRLRSVTVLPVGELFWFHTCIMYFVQRWLRVKLRFNCLNSYLLVLPDVPFFSIILNDWMGSTKGFAFICLTSSWCLCWFCTRLTRLYDVLYAVFGAGKAHKNNKGISERQSKGNKDEKVFSSLRRDLLAKKRYCDRWIRLTLIANTRIAKSC